MAPTNYKTVFRVEYKPTLDFYDKMFSIASALPGYPDWFTTGLSITLQNLDAWCSFSLAHNFFTYIRDMKEEEAQGGDDKRVRAILETVASKLEKKEYQRVGLRCWFLNSVEMSFDNLVSLVSERFLAQSEEIKEGICPKATDLAYVVHFMDNNLKVQLRAGPMRRDEIEQHFQPDRNANLPPKKRFLAAEELFSGFPEVSLLMDIDVSKKDAKHEELSQVYADAQKVQSKLSQNIVRYVFGLKEK